MTGYVDEEHIDGPSVFSGAVELDVRNADGLIVVSDMQIGIRRFAWTASRDDRARRSSRTRRRPRMQAAAAGRFWLPQSVGSRSRAARHMRRDLLPDRGSSVRNPRPTRHSRTNHVP